MPNGDHPDPILPASDAHHPVSAYETELIRENQAAVNEELIEGHNETIAWETAISLAKQLWSPDTFEANLQAERTAVIERLKKP